MASNSFPMMPYSSMESCNFPSSYYPMMPSYMPSYMPHMPHFPMHMSHMPHHMPSHMESFNNWSMMPFEHENFNFPAHFPAHFPTHFPSHMPWGKMHHEMNNWMRHALPREVRDVVFRPMNMLEYNSFAHPVEYHMDGSRSLRVAFDVKGFKPEEMCVTVSTKERSITVECKHDIKEKEHNVTRHYMRKFVLPEDLHIDLTKVELKSFLTPDGMFIIEGCLPRITVEELKALREKTPSKTPYMPTGMTNFGGVVGPVISIPIKTVA